LERRPHCRQRDGIRAAAFNPEPYAYNRPGADIERARRERSFISMQTTGPAFVPQPRRERTAFVAVAPPWHRLGPLLTLAGAPRMITRTILNARPCEDASLHLQPADGDPERAKLFLRAKSGWSTARITIATPSLLAISRWSSSRSPASSSVAWSSRPRFSIQYSRIRRSPTSTNPALTDP
jgi:hypothetical protein